MAATRLLPFRLPVSDPAPDADLLRRFIETRDESAFAELVRRHGPVVYRVCRRLLGASAADDAFQATFLVLACQAKRVRKAGSVGSWLVGVAGRVAQQMRKRELRHALRANPENQRRGDADPLTDVRGSPGTADLAAVLDDELARLPDHLRGPVIACLVQGRTQEQAVAELGGSVRTLRRRLDEAKRLLRERLERRGVVPAVAAGLVSGLGGPAAAVPGELSCRTVFLVSDFLAGGAASVPAAVLAKGVLTAMLARKVTLAVLSAAVGLTALGVGLADEKPRAQPTKPMTTAGPAPETKVREAEKPESSDCIAVKAVSPAAARAIRAEADFQYRALSRGWLAGPPSSMTTRNILLSIVFTGGGESTRPHGSTEIQFSDNGTVYAKMKLGGPLEKVLDFVLPAEMTRVVLAGEFRRSIPKWAEDAAAGLCADPYEQAELYAGCGQWLANGHLYKVNALLHEEFNEKDDAYFVQVQGYAITKFLVEQKGKPAFVRFLAVGGSRSWADAVKEVYGYDSVDDLQYAWIDWFRQNPPVGRNTQGQADPNRIPPVKLDR
jgi:RNA polymerase sigma factor (sigma-70 family)